MERPSSITWFMDSYLCHRVAFYLVIENRGEPVDYDTLYLAFLLWEWEPHPSTDAFKRCLRKLEGVGYVKQEHRKDEELKRCEERAKMDKRVKNPTRYCLRRGLGRVENIVVPSDSLRHDFLVFLTRLPYVVYVPGV